MAAGVLLVAGARTAFAQNGTITGKVIEKASNRPIPSATVRVIGTTIGAITGDDGTYRLRGVPPGRAEVRAVRIGYGAESKVVTLAAGGTESADFALTESPVSLDVVTVSAQGNPQAKRESGASVDVVPVDSINKATITNFSDVLTARVAGVDVQTSGGTTGTGSRVRIRGSNSISLNNDPLIVIDGIRVNNSSNSSTIAVGGQVPSRFDDLNPEDIENIEVIKGPAASALFGTAAANGVIQITTKHGRAGKAEWNVHADGGGVSQPYDPPNNYAQVGILAGDTTRVTGCTLIEQNFGQCTPKGDSAIFFNPLKANNVFVNGYRGSGGVNVSGGSEATTYYIAGNFDQEQGVYAINTRRKINLRTNLHAQISDNFDVTINAGYLQSRLRLPQNDNNLFGVWANGLLGSAQNDSVTHGFFLIPPSQSFAIDTRQDLERFTSGGTANFRPLSWLSFNATTGIDYGARYDNEVQPANNIVSFGDAILGNRTSNPYQTWFYTANLGTTAQYHLGQAVQASTSVGIQYYDAKTRGTSAFGKGLVPGTGSLGGTSTQFAVGEVNPDEITFGWYAQEQLNWRERLYGQFALRGDKNSSFGQDFGVIYYPLVSLSWVIGEEPFFPKWDWLSALRLRTAYGESGQAPAFRDATSFYTVLPWQADATDQAGLTLGGVGNANLRPERSKEYEAGFDAAFLKNRLGVEFTYYNKNTNDAIVSRVLPPSTGATSILYNVGQVNNKGWEANLDADIIKLDNFGFALRVLANQNTNKIVNSGPDTTPIIFGLGGNTQEHAQGYSLGGYWQKPYTVSDKNHNGLVDFIDCSFITGAADGPNCDLTIGSKAVFIGSPFPKHEFSFQPRFTLFKYFQVSGLLDRRSGVFQYNSTESFRCKFEICTGLNNPKAPLNEQARGIATLFGLTDYGYIEDASFWKLRELAFTAFAPVAWNNRLRVKELSLTVAARNLKTWSKYTGLDPEINQTGPDNFITADFLSQPPLRFWTARLNVVW